VRRYGAIRPWPVAGLALVAAAGAVVMTSGVSSAFDGQETSGQERTVGTAMSYVPGIEARAGQAGAPAPIPAPAAPAAAAGVEAAGLEAAGFGGEWQVQAGAFRRPAAAQAHLSALEAEVPEVGGLAGAARADGEITRVRIGGIADEAAARGLCERIAGTGRACFVVAPGS
jgi:cell division septation protein DedD